MPRLFLIVLLCCVSLSSLADEGLALLAAERRTKPENTLNPEERELMRLERHLLQLFMEGRVDEAMSHLHETAMVLPPGVNAIIGRSKQQVMFEQLLATEGFELSWEPVDPFIGPSGDMGYVYGVVRWKLPEQEEEIGKYISIWIKEDGRWLNHVEMRNTMQ